MMNALDGRPTLSSNGSSDPVNTRLNHAAAPGRGRSNKSGVTSTRRQPQRNNESAANVDDLPTDVNVDSVSLKNPSQTKDHFEGRLVERNDSVVRGALVELQQLREGFSNHRFLRVSLPSSATTPVDKENRMQRPPPSASGRPFGALLDSLRRMNAELGGGRSQSVLPPVPPAEFQLLRLPPPQEQRSPLKLPSLVLSPGRAWESSSPEVHRPMPVISDRLRLAGEFRQMPPPREDFPLLHLSEDRFPSTDRDAPCSEGLPFPILRMVDPRHRPVPFFVSPENIISCNNNNNDDRKARTVTSERSQCHTGQFDVPTSARHSIELLQLGPSLSEASDEFECDSRQVHYTFTVICIFVSVVFQST